MSEPKPRRRNKPPGRVEQAAERVVDAIRDGVREIELGLDAGDHTPIGELAGVIEEVRHPEGEEDGPPARRR
jgi:hypothetical protein